MNGLKGMKNRVFAMLLAVLLVLCSVDYSVLRVAAADETGTPIASWAELQNAFKNGGNYVLTADVESTEDTEEGLLEVPADVTVTLDLAGYKVDRSLDSPLSGGQVMKISGTLTVNDSAGGGVITGGYGEGAFLNAAAVYVGGTFTLNGGSISGNRSSGDCEGTGVAVYNNATFIMNGGSICDNHGEGSESYGGGVYAYPDAIVKLLGGSIKNNSVKGSYGGGGLYFQGSNVTVGGSIVIQDNKANGITSNVKGGVGVSLLLSETEPLTDEAKIGWTVHPFYDDVAVANGAPVAKGKNAANYVDNFFSDQDTSYIIGVKAGDTETIYIAPADSTVVSKPGASTPSTPVETHEHDGGPFEPWSASSIRDLGNGNDSLNAGDYYLTEDVTLTHELIVSGITARICLNGHTIDLGGKAIYLESGATLTIYDCDANATTGKITNGGGHYASSDKGGAIYVKESTLNLYGGSIENNKAEWGGAIFIDASAAKSTVNMYGGTIQKNTAQLGGGGIEVENAPSASNGQTGSFFNMYGGSIVDNKVTKADGIYHKGGGVHFNNAGMTIDGKVNITGNTVAGVENNVYLRSGKTITVTSIEEGSKIGVSAYDIENSTSKQNNVITSGYGTRISNSAIKYFFLDGTHNNSQYALTHTGTELQIQKHAHAWKYVAGTGNNADKLYAYCETTASKCEYYGESCTALPLKITAQTPFTYTGSAYGGAALSAEELAAFNAATSKSLSNSDIVYYTKEDLSEKTTTADGAAGDGKAPVNVGTYYAAVTVDGVTAKAKFTIKASATDPTAVDSLTYNGNPQQLINAGETTDGTICYSLNGTEWITDASKITGTNAGNYTVYWKLEGNDTYKTIPVTIQKAKPTAGTVLECIIMSGDLLNTAKFDGCTMKGVDGKNLPGTFKWKDGGGYILGADGKCTAVFKPTDTTNYEEVEVSINVKVYHQPSAKITVKTDEWKKLLSVISFGIYHTTEQDVVIEGIISEYGGYDIAKIYYYIDTTGNTEVLSATDLESRWQEYNSSNKPKVAAQSKNVIYAKITDEGGNEVIICSNGIIIDGQAPIAAVTVNGNAYTTSDNRNIKDSADLSIAITDQGDAGLQSATAFYQKEGDTGTTDITLTDGAGTATITTPGEYTLTLNANDKAGNAMTTQVYKFKVAKAQTITLTDATVKNAATGQPETGYAEGDTVMITADKPKAGYVFDHWEISGIELSDEQKKSSVITITIPGNGITVKAIYRENASGSDGSLATEVKVEPGTPATSVSGLDQEVAKKLLNDAELRQVESGENLLVYLKVNKLKKSDVPAEDKTKTEKQAARISNLQQGVYLDLSMWKKIGAAPETQVMNAETAKKLTIKVALPEELKAPLGKVRTYYVIRVHNGVATLLPVVLNGSEISFETDMFSTYSIWYTEDAAPASPSGGNDTQGTPSTPDKQNSNVKAPKTGDESNLALWSTMLLMSTVALAGITAKRKKDRDSVITK